MQRTTGDEPQGAAQNTVIPVGVNTEDLTETRPPSRVPLTERNQI
jgi:hypothetical protein